MTMHEDGVFAADAPPLVPATGAATPAPAFPTQGIDLTSYNTLRVAYHYTGAVTAVNVRWWLFVAGRWCKAFDTNEDVPLAPTTNGAEVRDYRFGTPSRIFAQVLSVDAGTQITIHATGVNL